MEGLILLLFAFNAALTIGCTSTIIGNQREILKELKNDKSIVTGKQ